MKNRFFFWLLSLLLAAAPAVTAPAFAAPKVAASSYVLMDAATGAVLAAENADEPLPPASLTKLMTAYLVFEALKNNEISFETQVPISRNAWASNVVGSKMFLEVNTQASVADLLRGIIIQSGNDACIAVAEYFSGDQQAFAELMNSKAQQMGLTNSHFENPTGLPAPSQQMSARDAAVLARRTIVDFPQWYPLYAETEFTYNGVRQENRNGLLRQFAGADGLKTGYTKAAGYSLVASAERSGRRLIAVVMKTKSPRARVAEAGKLLTYGFNHFKNVRLFGDDDRWRIPVFKGEADFVRVRIDGAGTISVPKSTDIDSAVYLPPTLEAPFAEGAVVGTLSVKADGEESYTLNIIATEAVAEAGVWKWLKDTIKIKYLGHRSDGELLSE